MDQAEVVNYYYNPDVEGEDENSLLHLCRSCKAKLHPTATWASRGSDDMFCEECGVQNNPSDPL